MLKFFIMKVHFIGIGGIGVSALARYFLKKGAMVTGSDLTSSETTDALRKEGAAISIGKHNARNISRDFNLVIYSPAVENNNPEIEKAQTYGIKMQSYPEALGDLTRNHFTIAVSGTHGKSTTTALIGLLLVNAGLDPTVIVGTKIREFGNSNCRVGKSEYLVIEADEWKASFLNYRPAIIVLTNIEREHLDYYRNLTHIQGIYKKYLGHLTKNGTIVANQDDKNVYRLVKNVKIKYPIRTVWYSLKENEAKKIGKTIKIPGKHNIYNALAVLKVSRELGIMDKIFYKTISDYKGAWRRFEIIKDRPYVVISDYGHHPTEIKATISGAKERYGKRKIWVIFQPHQRQRTFFLFKDFIRAFDDADELILTEIYDVVGREKEDISSKISTDDLVAPIKKRDVNVKFIARLDEIPEYLRKRIERRDVVLVMGAGSIYKIAEKL